MSKLNVKAQTKNRTYEGAASVPLSSIKELERTILTCMLWEDNFYERGEDVASRVKRLVKESPSLAVIDLAVKARNEMFLRHIPLLLLREVARSHKDVGNELGKAITKVIQRPDELTEFLAIYWKDGKCPLSKQVKKGLANAFTKFDEYQLAKYNRDSAIKLKDVLFLVHAKPKDETQGLLWKKLIDNTMAIPYTWETELSAGKDKKEVFTKLLQENKIGGLAVLRNLRNMYESGVNKKLVSETLLKQSCKSKILPFRYLAASRVVPQWERFIDEAMLKSTETMEKSQGKTLLLVDVSGSMSGKLSSKSDLTRLDAACALGVLCREIFEDITIATFSERTKIVPNRRGMALVEAIDNSQPHGRTYLKNSLRQFHLKYDRIIVITDEQSHDGITQAYNDKSYLINVANYKNGVGYDKGWKHISGFSENIIKYIQEIEKE